MDLDRGREYRFGQTVQNIKDIGFRILQILEED